MKTYLLLLSLLLSMTGCAPVEASDAIPMKGKSAGFKAWLVYGKSNPVLKWEKVEHVTRYEMYTVNVVTGAMGHRFPIDPDFTSYTVPCSKFQAIQMNAILSDGRLLESKLLTVNTSKCLAAPEVQIVSTENGILVDWTQIPMADYYVVSVRNPETRALVREQLLLTHSTRLQIPCGQNVEISVYAMKDKQSSDILSNLVRSKYKCE